MISPVFVCAASFLTAPLPDTEVEFRTTVVRPGGAVLSHGFLDVDGENGDELVVAWKGDGGQRYVDVYPVENGHPATEPASRTRIPERALAWLFVEVFADDGVPELVVLDPDGALVATGGEPAWQRLFDAPLLFALPAPGRLDRWPYVVRRARAPDFVLVPTRDSLLLFGVAQDEGAPELPWVPRAEIDSVPAELPADPEDDRARARSAARSQERRVDRLTTTLDERIEPFLDDAPVSTLIDDTANQQSPALVDINSDGHVDLVLATKTFLRVHLGTVRGLDSEPTRIEMFPDWLTPDGDPAALRIVDLNNDAALDLIGVWREDAGDLENGEWRVYVLLGTHGALIPKEPSRVLRFKASDLRVALVDVDGDNRLDLAVRGLELPGLVGAAVGVQFEHFHAVFFGERRGTFTRRPTIRQRFKIDASDVRTILKGRDLVRDFDGDGLIDVVETGFDGEIGLRRIQRESSLFGHVDWTIEEEPSRILSGPGPITQAEVHDLNLDGVGDVVGIAPDSLTLIVSSIR